MSHMCIGDGEGGGGRGRGGARVRSRGGGEMGRGKLSAAVGCHGLRLTSWDRGREGNGGRVVDHLFLLNFRHFDNSEQVKEAVSLCVVLGGGCRRSPREGRGEPGM